MAVLLADIKASDGSADPSLMHVMSPRIIGATTLVVDGVAAIPTTFVACAGSLNAQGFIDPSTMFQFKGHVDGANLEIDEIMPGSVDAGNTAGQVVVIRPNTWVQNFIAAILAAFPGANIVAASIAASKLINLTIGSDKIKAQATASLTSKQWSNGTYVSSLATNLRSGISTNGMYQTDMTLNLASLGIPDTATVLEYHFMLHPGDNIGGLCSVPTEIVSISRGVGTHSIGLTGIWPTNSATAPNNANSGVSGFVTYIPSS